MNCPFCQTQLMDIARSGRDWNRFYCSKCIPGTNSSNLFDFHKDGTLLRYEFRIGKYSVRVSYKTKTIRLYFEKDVYGITEPMMTINFTTDPGINPKNARKWIKKLKTLKVFS